jgi:hypothetical protein
VLQRALFPRLGSGGLDLAPEGLAGPHDPQLGSQADLAEQRLLTGASRLLNARFSVARSRQPHFTLECATEPAEFQDRGRLRRAHTSRGSA